jgi:hypothetical protein
MGETVLGKLVKIIVPSVIAAVVTAVLLILFGLSTSSVLTNEGTYFTSTTVQGDINVFAFSIIIGVFLAVAIAIYAVEALSKNS